MGPRAEGEGVLQVRPLRAIKALAAVFRRGKTEEASVFPVFLCEEINIKKSEPKGACFLCSFFDRTHLTLV